jgi:hypothetical protein
MYNARTSVLRRHRAPYSLVGRAVEGGALHFFARLPGFPSRAPIVDDVNSPA